MGARVSPYAQFVSRPKTIIYFPFWKLGEGETCQIAVWVAIAKKCIEKRVTLSTTRQVSNIERRATFPSEVWSPVSISNSSLKRKLRPLYLSEQAHKVCLLTFFCRRNSSARSTHASRKSISKIGNAIGMVPIRRPSGWLDAWRELTQRHHVLYWTRRVWNHLFQYLYLPSSDWFLHRSVRS